MVLIDFEGGALVNDPGVVADWLELLRLFPPHPLHGIFPGFFSVIYGNDVTTR